MVPIEKPALRAELRYFLDTQLADPRSAWVMQPDGSYVQRRPPKGKRKSTKGCHQIFIDHAEKRQREASRLKRRHPRGMRRRQPR